MKNNFSNFIKIILIIVGIVLVIGLVFYLITKNDYSANHSNTTSNPEIDPNISLIEDELVNIFSYINNTKETDNISCRTLGSNLGYDITSANNFFNYYAPIIMDCLHELDYPTLYYNSNLSYKIISPDEFANYSDYFLDLTNFNLVSNIYSEDILASYTQEEQTIVRDYINQNYLIAYEINNNSSLNSVNYKVHRIFKKEDYFQAIIIAEFNNQEYTGVLNIRILDDHLQYGRLIFY